MTEENCLRWTQHDQIKYRAVSMLSSGGRTTPTPEVVEAASQASSESGPRVAPWGWCLSWVSHLVPAGVFAAHDSHQEQQQKKGLAIPEVQPVAACSADGTRLRPWGVLALEELLVGEGEG